MTTSTGVAAPKRLPKADLGTQTGTRDPCSPKARRIACASDMSSAGSAIPAEDISEAQAIRLALGEQGSRVPVCVPKSAFGNLFGAATPVDVVIALLAMQHRTLPATLHLDQPAPDCHLEHVTKHPRSVDRLDVIAVNARGIGGANASLVLRRWPEERAGGTGA